VPLRVRETQQGLLRQAQVETLNSTFVDREARFAKMILEGEPGSRGPTFAGLQVAVNQTANHGPKAHINRVDGCLPIQSVVYAFSGVASAPYRLDFKHVGKLVQHNDSRAGRQIFL
jgi:hypothetical protein